MSVAIEGAGGDALERIRVRAYEIFLQREGEAGSALEDWLAAEREVTTAVAAESSAYEGDLKVSRARVTKTRARGVRHLAAVA